MLSGHLHRAQALTRAPDGRRLAAPVLYPGSIERTSFAEMRERKGFLTLALEGGSGRLLGWRFHSLPARPMRRIELGEEALARRDLEAWLRAELLRLPEDAVVQLRVAARLPPRSERLLSAASLRALAPETMNVELRLPAQGER